MSAGETPLSEVPPTPEEQARIEIATRRYHAAAHGMQSGVAWEQGQGSTDGTPKHLRVGVNSAQVATAALARMLIDRGLFTLAEYTEAQADEMEREVQRYRDRNPGLDFA